MKSKAENSKKPKIPVILKIIRILFPILEIIPPLAKAYARYLFFKPLKYPYQEPELKYLDKSKKTKISFEGKNISVYSWGSGTPILFVHGWSGRGAQFWKFVDPFVNSDYKVITFDAPALFSLTSDLSSDALLIISKSGFICLAVRTTNRLSASTGRVVISALALSMFEFSSAFSLVASPSI